MIIASLSRAVVSGLPGAVHPGALQSLLQQSAGVCQDLDRLQAWHATPSAALDASDGVGAPAPSSYAGPLPAGHPHAHPLHHHHHTYHHHDPQHHPFFHPSASAPSAAHLSLPHRRDLLQQQHVQQQLQRPQLHQLHQLRGYRIPNRVPPPKVAYSERTGRPAPQPWPEFEAVKAPQGEVRWHRSVVRFPPEVAVQLEGEGERGAAEGVRTLVLSGKAGTIRLSLQDLDPTGLLAFRLLHLPASAATPGAKPPASQPPAFPQRSLLVLASPNKARFDEAGAALNRAIRGVMTGHLVGLTVKGVGYRMEPLEDPTGEVAARVPSLSYAQRLHRARAPGGALPKPYYFEAAGEEKQAVTFPYNKPAPAIRLKVGYSRTVVYPLPPHIRAFCLKPTLLYLYGLELDELQRVAAEIRGIRKPNPYTGNGVQYVDEVVKLKQRARAK